MFMPCPLVMNNTVDALARNLTGEDKKERQQIIAERKQTAECAALFGEKKGTKRPKSANPTTVSTVKRKRYTGASSSSDDSASSSTASYDPGIPGAQYGGYGRCLICKKEGHWAPGCKDREKNSTCFRCGKKGHWAARCTDFN